ncbi:DUF302 domain-containing protein [Flavihumibacter profundi]|uniref:DUF302 domain-containing protein n=1 Tax=Flavihumibacter profundi TaxID=2716883 RepID=UPI001CC71A26|nr:DUF302 domain-containing protein [Flavihumibacter profundi]MBZ5859400.1 DUF302 domain-containing protein [Flavihumibacter profundi]
MKQESVEAMVPAAQLIEMFTFKIASNQPIEKITANVPAVCEKNKFSILQTFNYQEILEGKGFPIQRKVFIYEICQAKVAAKMLTTNPEFSIFMPCKIAIYENDGHTIISTMNMEIALKAVEDNVELYNEATAMFNTLKALLVSLKNS